MSDLNRVELDIISKVTQKHKGAPHLAIQKLFKFYDVTNNGISDLKLFLKSMESVTGNVNNDVLNAIFYRYSNGEEGMDYRVFARDFVDGRIRDTESAPLVQSKPIDSKAIISKISAFLKTADKNTLINFALEIRAADFANTRTISPAQLSHALLHGTFAPLKLSLQDVQTLTLAFIPYERPNAVKYDQLIRSLQVPISGRRLNVLQAVFDRIDIDCDAAVSVEDLSRSFQPSCIASVANSFESPQEALQRFFNNLESIVAFRRDAVDPAMRSTGSQLMHTRAGTAGTTTRAGPLVRMADVRSISWEDFCELYSFIGACTVDDDEFESLVKAQWNLQKPHVPLDVFEPRRQDPAQLGAAGHMSPQRVDLHTWTDGKSRLPIDPKYRAPRDATRPSIPFERAANLALQIGTRAAATLTSLVLAADSDRDGKLTLQDLREIVLKSEGLLRFSADEEADVFRSWGVTQKGPAGQMLVVIPVHGVLEAIWGSLEGPAFGVISEAWRFVSEGRNSVPISEIERRLDCSEHPLVTRGAVEAYLLKREWIDVLRSLAYADPASNTYTTTANASYLPEVTEPIFYIFHQILAAGASSPAVFTAVILRVWNLPLDSIPHEEQHVEQSRQRRPRTPSPRRGRSVSPEERDALRHGESIPFARGAIAYPEVKGQYRPVDERLGAVAGTAPGYPLSTYIQGLPGDAVKTFSTKDVQIWRDLHHRFRRQLREDGAGVDVCRENVTYKSRINISPQGGVETLNAIVEKIRSRLATYFLVKPIVNLFSQADKFSLSAHFILPGSTSRPATAFEKDRLAQGLNKAEWLRFAKYCSLGLSENELDFLFKAFQITDSSLALGKMDIYAFILAVEGDLAGIRAEWVAEAWTQVLKTIAERECRVDEEGYLIVPEFITVEQLISVMRWNSHPGCSFAPSNISNPARSAAGSSMDGATLREDFRNALLFFVNRRNGDVEGGSIAVDAEVFGDVMHAVSAVLVKGDEFRLFTHACFGLEF